MSTQANPDKNFVSLDALMTGGFSRVDTPTSPDVTRLFVFEGVFDLMRFFGVTPPVEVDVYTSADEMIPAAHAEDVEDPSFEDPIIDHLLDVVSHLQPEIEDLKRRAVERAMEQAVKSGQLWLERFGLKTQLATQKRTTIRLAHRVDALTSLLSRTEGALSTERARRQELVDELSDASAVSINSIDIEWLIGRLS